jgi:hypothetical protein
MRDFLLVSVSWEWTDIIRTFKEHQGMLGFRVVGTRMQLARFDPVS